MSSTDSKSNVSTVPLVCHANNYAWGKLGQESTVAALAAENIPGFTLNPFEPYSEFWMGTHPNGPSHLLTIDSNGLPVDSGVSLEETIGQQPQAWLGSAQPSGYEHSLAFLFKVLSIGRALSIQAHPDKQLAQSLHQSNPKVYKDGNHKPEMAVAVTEFSALCGFRAPSAIAASARKYPALASLLGDHVVAALEQCDEDNPDQCKPVLKDALAALVDADQDTVAQCIESHLVQLKEEQQQEGESSPDERLVHFQTLSIDFPGDSGCFVLYLLNLIDLQPGQAFFMGPNVPHAYLNGDIVECMACSDNVVRAGLTPKLKDKDTLLSMLTYEFGPADQQVLQPTQLDDFTQLYDPPIDEFAVSRTVLPAATSSYSTPALNGPSIFLVLSGTAAASGLAAGDLALHTGSVLFVPANASIGISVDQDSDDFVLFRAVCAPESLSG